MDGTGRVEAIHIAPESAEETEPTDEAEAVAGEGVRGDRHFGKDKADITLIETEALDAAREEGVDLDDGEHRRNLTTSDAALNHLVGERFRVGDVVCEGTALCEPCSHLESLTEEGAISTLVHRGGLEADVIESGEIAVGDEIEPL
jgi:MOSC domain-containing protein YiiM